MGRAAGNLAAVAHDRTRQQRRAHRLRASGDHRRGRRGGHASTRRIPLRFTAPPGEPAHRVLSRGRRGRSGRHRILLRRRELHCAGRCVRSAASGTQSRNRPLSSDHSRLRRTRAHRNCVIAMAALQSAGNAAGALAASFITNARGLAATLDVLLLGRAW